VRELLEKIRRELVKEHRARGRCVNGKECPLQMRVREIDAVLRKK